MIKELFIFLFIVSFVGFIKLVNYLTDDTLYINSFWDVMIGSFGPFHLGSLIIFIYVIVFLFRWIILKPIGAIIHDDSEKDVEFVNTLHAQSRARIKTYAYFLFFIITVFFTSTLYWAYWAEIDELARGEGKVIPSAKIQTIQSLDGGVISEILVKEGFIITKGQPLMKIDTTRFQASLDENRNTLEDLLASRVRLEEEIKIDVDQPMPELHFNDEKLKNHPDIIETQQNLFKTRFEELKANIQTLQMQVAQKEQELVELKSKRNQLWQSIKLIKEEMATIEQLVARKARPNIDLISIKREYQGLAGEYNAARLSIPRAELSIQESQNNVLEKINMFKSAAAEELQKINGEIKKYESKVISEKDKLEKTVIVSPVNGIIKQIHINTIGGVVRSGADLIEIVPDSEILLVEAKIDPKDIAFINPSQKAIVKITAYDFSIYGGLEGKIVEISADSLEDEDSRDGKTYYKVVIQTTKNYLEKDGERFSIIPGMIASVDIITGKKSILDFILKPIIKTKESALHER